MTNEYPDRLDSILNEALRDYSNVEPRVGLEQRILRRVQTAPPRRSRWRFAWALVPVAIALIVWIAVPTREVSRAVIPLSPPPVPSVAQAVIPGLPRPRTTGHRLRGRDKLPEPLPMSPEERALLRFVQKQPEQAWAALFQPAEIQALEIEPLEIEELQ